MEVHQCGDIICYGMVCKGMSIVEEIREVILTDPNMIKQLKGVNKIIDSVLIALDVSKVIDKTVSERFLIQVDVMLDGNSYTITGIHSMSEIDERGLITVGRLYVLGPLQSQEPVYRATIRYLVDN